MPKSVRLKFLTSAHYGHQGIESMMNKLTRDYFWPGMKNDVVNFVKGCRVCSLVKPRYMNAHLKPYLLDAPMQLVAADYVGPLPISFGFRYMLVIVDGFSRFPEVYPVRDLTVKTLISKFRDFFARYGFPDALITRSSRAMNLKIT